MASIDIPNSSDGSTKEDTPSSVSSHQRLIDEFTIKQKAKSLTLNVPTDDRKVKISLRERGHPICLFGEGPFERRERLRFLVAKETEIPDKEKKDEDLLPLVKQVDSLPENELFYTEGHPSLQSLRASIAKFSLHAAAHRLVSEAKIKQSITRKEFEQSMKNFHQHFKQHLSLSASQVADDRPLTDGTFSTDGLSFATTSWSGLIKLWDVSTCELKKVYRGHNDRIYGLCWRNDDYLLHADNDDNTNDGVISLKLENSDYLNNPIILASAAADGTVCLWGQNSASCAANLTGHEERANRVAFHPSNRLLASTSHDETWRLWDLETTEELLLQEGHGSAVFPVKFHPDGSLVITGGADGTILLWDLRSGKEIAQFSGHLKLVYALDFDPLFPHRVASASEDNTVRIWDLRTRTSSNNLLAHDKLISKCLFEPRYGRYLLTASYDCSVKFWSTVDFSLIHHLPVQESRVTSASISPDCTKLAIMSFDRTWKLWQLGCAYEEEFLDDFLD